MSIINKMHQDYKQVQEEQPILAKMPEKGNNKKTLILFVIILLLCTSFGLSYLIFTKKNNTAQTPLPRVEQVQSIPVNSVQNTAIVQPEVVKETLPISNKKAVIQELPVVAIEQPLVESKIEKVNTKEQITIVESEAIKPIAVEPVQGAPDKKVANEAKPSPKEETPKQVTAEVKKESVLEIKTVKLSKPQLAQIRLKEGAKLEAKGELELAAEKRKQALILDPSLNEIRKTLALYYFGQGNIEQTQRLLQTGAMVSPEYSDFNLMLSRIALKDKNYQKAYLYLEQHPPEVVGHLDYYASHAILAQKLGKHVQSENLYSKLLSQRPNNGRWRMSLAIAQDKLGKVENAIINYKNALLQTDLSIKAKAYINQRLTYLEKTL